MSNSKKTHELIRQNEKNVKKSLKHDVNLQKNSTFYFQIGLIVCLLAAYGLFEMKFETIIPKEYVHVEEDIYNVEETALTVFKVYEPEVKPVEKQQQTVFVDEHIIVEDDTPDVVETLKLVTEPVSTNEPIAPEGLSETIEVPVDTKVDFVSVEIVPIYPGCEKKKTNAERRKCMSEKITKLIQKKFDTELATELGLKGKQVIQTQFTIDKEGQVTNIKTRAVHPKLEKEADRVINKIPEMEPGKQRDKNVGVIYNLPIIFKVQN